MMPHWGSKSAGGNGPGAWARLIEIGRADGSGFWLSLAADPDGNRLKVSTHIEGVPTALIDTPIQWPSNQWRQIALAYGTRVEAIVDGNVIGSGPAVPLWPPVSEWPQYLLSFGGGLHGQELAQGELDELTTFAGPVSAEYLAWQYGQTAPLAMLGPILEEVGRAVPGEPLDGEMMTMSGPPPPGGGGGGGSDPPAGMVTDPGLKLTVPRVVGSVLSTSLRETDTNSAYEIFHRLTLVSTSKWVRAASGDLGQTNFSVTVPSTNTAFYRAAEIFDTDFDGLSDAYEEWVSSTSKTNPDTDDDGIPDGQDDANANGVPDYIDYAGLNRAVIWASRPNAFEGALAGELTIQLPTPAPTNNTLIMLHLSPNVDYDGDYYLTKQDTGARVTNDMFFAAGQTQQKILVHAINDSDQAPRPRKLQAKLASSANYQLDWQMGEVALVDNDLPLVWIWTLDAESKEGSGTNNQGMFVLTRQGSVTNTLSVTLTRTGTASNGVDCVSITNLVVFPTNVSTVQLPVTSLSDTNYEADETLTLTIQPAAGVYVIHTNGAAATLKILDDDLPVVSLIATDLIGSEYAPGAATITVRRSGYAGQPLTVPLSIGGTASIGEDYQPITNIITMPANSNEVAILITPLTDGVEEQVETITVTLKGSHSYIINTNSNTQTVILDDDKPTRYEVVQLKSTSAYGGFGIDSPAIIEIRRYGRSSSAANIAFQVFTNNGAQTTIHYRVYGDILNPTTATLPAYATKARLNFTSPVCCTTGNQKVEVRVPTVSSTLWPVHYQPERNYVRLEVVSTNAVEGQGAQGRIRASRLVTGPAVTLSVAVSGSALPGVDHNLSSSILMTIPENQYWVEATFSATADAGGEGWESLIFTPDVNALVPVVDHRNPFMAFIRDNVSTPELLSEPDYDLDELSDRWELANNFDPFAPGEAELDTDKDGLTNLEEAQSETNPRQTDSDTDGQSDFAETVRDLASDDSFVEVLLRTRDSGKSNNGLGCAVCHTTVLKVDGFSHYSSQLGIASEKKIYLRKGTNYPIYLRDLFRDFPPTGNFGSPTNSAKYDAEILAPTNTPRAFVISGAQTNKLGVNKDYQTFFPADPTVSIGTVTVPKIEVLWTNVPGNVPLDTNINAGDGLRVFPDRLSPTDGTARNIVRVRVRTIPPLPAAPDTMIPSSS